MSKRSSTKPNLKRITRDWLELFPQFGRYGSMWLGRVCGPVFQGVCLNRTSLPEYQPIAHIHSLLIEWDAGLTITAETFLPSSMTGAPDTVKYSHHESKYRDAADRLVRASPLPLEGALNAGDVFDLLCSRGGPMDPAAYEDAVALASAVGWSEEASRLAEQAPDILRNNRRLQHEGDFVERVQGYVAAGESLMDAVPERIQRLKLDSLPTCDWIVPDRA